MNEPANFGTNEQRPWNCRRSGGPGASPAPPPLPSRSFPQPTAPDPCLPTRLSDKTLCMVARQGEERELRHYDVHNLYGWSETKPTLEALQAATGKRGFVVTPVDVPEQRQVGGALAGGQRANWNHLGDSITGEGEGEEREKGEGREEEDVAGIHLFGIPTLVADICGFSTTQETECWNSTCSEYPTLVRIFADSSTTQKRDCERWMELGAFYPTAGATTPWRERPCMLGMMDPGLWPSVAASSRKALRIRYTLLPYLYTLHFLAATTGSTVVRPLFFE
ncbi:hypothetical protein C7M84_017494 [Penaeus vannamei]|uniref:Glycoside hydrolase family 31 TIM barrel domain-containing protein n=1 Tax=Penaeus vannamei TaxID=6689 RepID=A0A3R7LUD7_PENVA|nr:hypothetical protein C7M84_017494 [Penaeus vannamei]